MQIEKKAYAKINLSLDVLRRREDGYHEVKMIMQMIDLFDVLTFEKREDDQIVISTNKANLPCDESNLIYKAAKTFFEATDSWFGVDIKLQKQIPMAAGMAGGSSDAAVTFLALNEMAGSPLSKDALMEISVKVGADVPYCILGGTALAEGIGEKLTVLQAPPQSVVLIAKPDIDVPTPFVYKNLHLETVTNHPDVDGMQLAIANQDAMGIYDRLGNVLETVTIPAYPVIGEIKAEMQKEGAINSLMSGSGPTVFGFFEDAATADKAADAIRERFQLKDVYVTKFVR